MHANTCSISERKCGERESVCRQVEGQFTVGTEAMHRSVHQHAHAETCDVDTRTPNMRRRLNDWSRTDKSTNSVV